MRKSLLRFWPVLVILGIWFTFSSPYFFQSKVPIPATHLVNSFRPWNYYREFGSPIKNDAMSDIISQIYPWKYLTIQSFVQGEIPFWNPYSFAGNPHLANYQTAVFSPFNLLFFILPFVDAWSLLILFQPLLAGLFMLLFMREIKVSKTGSVISSIAFMFCGFMVVWMAYGTLAMAIALLPLVLYAIEKSFHKNSFLSLPIVSLGIAISYFSGHVQTSLYLTLLSASYSFFKFLGTKNVRKLFLVLLFFAIGFLFVLAQIIPTLELYQQSIRSSLVYPDGQIPLMNLVTIFAPDFFGNPVTRNFWGGLYAEWANFIGIIPLILVLFAFLKSKPSVYFFTLTGILAFAFSSDTPLRQLLAVSGVPVFATSIPSRMVVLFSFSLAVLSGFGFDNLIAFIEQKDFRKLILPFAFMGFMLLIIWLLLLMFHVFPGDKTSIAMRNLVLPTILFNLVFILIVATFLITKLRLFHSFRVVPIVQVGIPLLLLVLAALDSLRFATKWMPFDDRKLIFPDLPVIMEIQKRIGYGRIFGAAGSQLTYYGIASLEGYDPLYIERYGEFMLTAKTGKYTPADRAVVEIGNRGIYTKRILDLLGVNLILFPKVDMNRSWAFPVWQDTKTYTKVYDDDVSHLYINNTALPRVKLFYDYEIIPNDRELLSRFYTENFDYRNILLVEEDPSVCSMYTCTGNSDFSMDKAEIVSYSPNKVFVSVEAARPALLFLSDNYYPDWKVKVNGKGGKIYRADYTFRAVPVPQGKSTVEFVYQ